MAQFGRKPQLVEVVNMRYPHNQQGFSLLEVLIAALVLAIGLVGLAGLNLKSLQSTHSSYYRSVATMIAIDAEERSWIALGDDGELLPEELSGIDGIADNLEDDWGFTELPDLDIEISVENSAPEWLEIEFVISWSERRFVGVSTESLGYRTRVPTGS